MAGCDEAACETRRGRGLVSFGVLPVLLLFMLRAIRDRDGHLEGLANGLEGATRLGEEVERVEVEERRSRWLGEGAAR